MSGPRFSYGTNGFALHRLDDALDLLADLGYAGVGLTLDRHTLDPYAPDLPQRLARLAGRLDRLGLAVAVETGAPYLLDPRREHVPSLITADPADRARRTDLVERAVRIAGELGARVVHVASGTPPLRAGRDELHARLDAAAGPLTELAAAHGVVLAVEPEPGHLVETVADVLALRRRLGGPAALGLTLDAGHAVAIEDASPAELVHVAGAALVHVQVSDARRGVHEHLELGEGALDLPGLLGALGDAGYAGLVSAELYRHSVSAPVVAARTLTSLRAAASSAHERLAS